jgi:hypothetical protein
MNGKTLVRKSVELVHVENLFAISFSLRGVPSDRTLPYIGVAPQESETLSIQQSVPLFV